MDLEEFLDSLIKTEEDIADLRKERPFKEQLFDIEAFHRLYQHLPKEEAPLDFDSFDNDFEPDWYTKMGVTLDEYDAMDEEDQQALYARYLDELPSDEEDDDILFDDE